MKLQNFLFLLFGLLILQFPINALASLSAKDKLPHSPYTVRLDYGKQPMQFGDLRMPAGKGPFPVVILIHGGCWLSKFNNLEVMSPIANKLMQDGIATWNIEYRKADQEGGGWPGTFLDVSNAINFLKKMPPEYQSHLNLKDVIVLGHSAGGHLALWAAAREKLPQSSDLYTKNNLQLRGVINLSGPENLVSAFPSQKYVCGENAISELLGGTPKEKPIRYQQASPIFLLPLGLKQILMVGDEDIYVPVKFPQAYATAAKKAGDTVQLFLIKNVGHQDIISTKNNAWPVIKKSVFNLLNANSN